MQCPILVVAGLSSEWSGESVCLCRLVLLLGTDDLLDFSNLGYRLSLASWYEVSGRVTNDTFMTTFCLHYIQIV